MIVAKANELQRSGVQCRVFKRHMPCAHDTSYYTLQDMILPNIQCLTEMTSTLGGRTEMTQLCFPPVGCNNAEQSCVTYI